MIYWYAFPLIVTVLILIGIVLMARSTSVDFKEFVVTITIIYGGIICAVLWMLFYLLKVLTGK